MHIKEWISIILIALAIEAQAAWYVFTPCGHKYEDMTKPVPKHMPFKLAPNFTVLYWWIPFGTAARIVGMSKREGGIECSYVSVAGEEWLVVGRAEDIYRRLSTQVLIDFRVPRK